MSIEFSTLLRFCSLSDGKFPKPIRLPDGTAATNQHLLIWVPEQHDFGEIGNPEKAAEHVTPLVNLAREASNSGTWRRVDSLRLQGGQCWRCNGTGHFAQTPCDECGGTGEFKHGSWMYDCKECDGEGRKSLGYTRPTDPYCSSCFGTGLIDSATDFTVRGKPWVTANQRYAVLLARLPNAELREQPMVWRENPIIPVRFDGGVGALMPLVCKPLVADEATSTEMVTA